MNKSLSVSKNEQYQPNSENEQRLIKKYFCNRNF